MGIVNDLRKKAENAERKKELMKAMCKRMCRERDEKAAAAEGRAAASERMNTILIARLGGSVEIADEEWSTEKEVIAEYDQDKKKTIFKIIE